MTNITVVPDIHANSARLDASIREAGDDRLAFLGDFIDAGKEGPDDDEGVLLRARDLIETGRAVAVLGNHELNAILFHRTNSQERPLRDRSDKNRAQHRSFIDRFGVGTAEALTWTEWFLTLPLWHDFGGLRIVHACWDATAIATIAERRPDGRLHPTDLLEVAAKETAFAQAVERLTSGPEVPLPADHVFEDHKGHRRSHVRVAWWLPPGATWREATLSVPDLGALPNGIIPASFGVPFYPADEPPVLVGHYKMRGDPCLATGQASSLDYSKTPLIYRWCGEKTLISENLITLPQIREEAAT